LRRAVGRQDRGPAGADRGVAEHRSELVEELEVLRIAEPAASTDDHGRLLELGA